jgi:hypothetical protein
LKLSLLGCVPSRGHFTKLKCPCLEPGESETCGGRGCYQKGRFVATCPCRHIESAAPAGIRATCHFRYTAHLPLQVYSCLSPAPAGIWSAGQPDAGIWSALSTGRYTSGEWGSSVQGAPELNSCSEPCEAVKRAHLNRRPPIAQ